MATAKPVAPVSLARNLPLQPPRRWRPDSTRAFPSITCIADAGGELPARLRPNGRRPLWHGGGFSLGVDLGAARTGLAIGRGITQPRPLTVRALALELCYSFASFGLGDLRFEDVWSSIPPGSEAAGAEAGAYAA
jgi:hypothetical protein